VQSEQSSSVGVDHVSGRFHALETDVNGEFIDIKFVRFRVEEKKEGKMISIPVNTVVRVRSEAFRESRLCYWLLLLVNEINRV